MLPPSPAAAVQMISHNQESANWRPIYSSVVGQHQPPMIMSASPAAAAVQGTSNSDMAMTDFGNFSMEEYFNMITGNTKSNRTPPPPSPPPLSHAEPNLESGFSGSPRVHHWSADQTGQSFHHSSPGQHHHHYQQHQHQQQQVHDEQQQIEQTRYDEEDEDSIIHQQQQTNTSEEDEIQQRPIQQHQSQLSY